MGAAGAQGWHKTNNGRCSKKKKLFLQKALLPCPPSRLNTRLAGLGWLLLELPSCHTLQLKPLDVRPLLTGRRAPLWVTLCPVSCDGIAAVKQPGNGQGELALSPSTQANAHTL